MTDDLVKAFLEKTNGDTNLLKRLKEASDINAVVAIAKEEGFDISADDFAKAKIEISEDDLESVAGGKMNWNYRGHNATHAGKFLTHFL